ncbi:MAG: SIMPL domain-containing protein [Anaerolineae bacterium]
MKHVKTFVLGSLALAMLLGVIAIGATASPFVQHAAAQDNSAGENIITVTGVGTAYGEPDVAYISVGADFTSENAGEAFAQASDTLNAVRDALLALGIAEQDLQTTNVSIYPQDNYNPADGSISGRIYRVSSAIDITIRDVTMIEDVINAAIGAGANNLYNLSFGIADPATLEQDARTQAVANARARAEQLAGLLGVTVGEPIIISETLNNGSSPIPVANAVADRAFGGGGGVPVDTGRMMVSVTVQITFRIGE